MGEPKDEAEMESVPAKAASGGGQLVILVIAMVVTVVGALGGALFWLSKTGRLPVQGAAATAKVEAKAEPVKSRLMLLEPLLVNLTDGGGASYLRVVIAVRVEDPPLVKGEKPKEEKAPEKSKVVVNEDEVRMRDAALTILGRETSEGLLEPQGKDRLREELKTSFTAKLPEKKVVDILFTEFLVQR
jgi:flagellar FliL protein